MELSDYLRVLRRNWILVIASALIGLIVAGLFSLTLSRTYTARTQLFVAIQSSGSVTELQQGNSFSQARVLSYVKTAVTPAVLQPAIDSLGLNTTPGELAKHIQASSDVNTVLITISSSDPSPVQAAAIAQAVADSLVKAVDSLEKSGEKGVSPVRLSVVTPATAPTSPSAPNVGLNLAVGLLGGLAIGLAAALLRTLLDTKIRGENDVRRVTSAAILGGIAYDENAKKSPLLTQIASQSPRAESFRQIRTNLQFAHVSNKSRTILVTSSLPGEGKSTTATNMAIAMSQAGQRVALVDADLRRPMVGDYLGLDRNAGLTTALVGQVPIEDLMQPWAGGNLHVLTSGQIPPNPSELLGSDAMSELIELLEGHFDAVIIDAPPLLPVTDAAVLAQKVGGVVLVIGSQSVTSQDVTKSLASLEMVNADLLGLIINKLPTKGADAYAYAYTSYAVESQPSRRASRRQTRNGETGSDDNFNRIIFGQSDEHAERR